MNDAVDYEVSDGVATITLNRPEMLNAMNNDLMGGISSAIDLVKNDDSVRLVVLTGAGRGFCAGADLNSAADPDPAGPSGDDIFNGAARALHNCPVPTIARINGAAAGGGFGLALTCDITIASDKAFFVATFVPNLGIVPDIGATWSIPRRVGRARALGISLLGERITAEQAQDWGLIWSCVPHDDLDTEVERVGAILKRSSPEAVTRTRQALDAAIDNSFSDQLDEEMRHQGVLIPKNMQVGAQAFLEKRDPEFPGDRG